MYCFALSAKEIIGKRLFNVILNICVEYLVNEHVSGYRVKPLLVIVF